VQVLVYAPNGTNIGNGLCYLGSGCNYPWYNLPQTGTYTVQIKPASTAQTMSFTGTMTASLTGPLTLNTSTPVTLNQLGQNQLLTFAATAGQTVALEVSGISSTPANTTYGINLYGPSGYISYTSTASATTINLPNLAAGSYSVLVYPLTPATATMQVALYSGAAGLMPNNGTSTNYSTSAPGQYAYLTFSATAGQNLNLALTGLALSPGSPTYVQVLVYAPNGTNIGNALCYLGSGCDYPWFRSDRCLPRKR
jgi:hypothetical protein